MPVTLSIDWTSRAVCAVTPDGTGITFIGVGYCHLYANQPGDAEWNAASIPQTIQVNA